VEKYHPQKMKDDEGHGWGIPNNGGIIGSHNTSSLPVYKDIKKIEGLPVHE